MALLLPAEGTDIADMLGALNGESFAKALNRLKEKQVVIGLPKFEIMSTYSLGDTLASMGMADAFDLANADFSGMTQEENDIFISEVLHKCYIRVNELGAEAAAVTGVMPAGSSPWAREPREFWADRPFLFAIYSQEDGAVAFLGVVNNPS